MPANQLIPPGVGGHDPTLAVRSSCDPATANVLLDRFGYDKRDPDGYRHAPDGSRLTLTMSLRTGGISRDTQTLWKKNMDVLGLRTEFDVMPFQEIIKNLEKGKFQMYQGGFGGSPSGYNEHAQLIEAGGCDFVQPDAPRVGGVTPFLRILALADAKGLQLAPHFAMEIHVHLAATYALRPQPFLLGIGYPADRPLTPSRDRADFRGRDVGGVEASEKEKLAADRCHRRVLEWRGERAGIRDGMDVLDLGCGWGALSLWIAERYPACRVVGVSNM